VFRGGWIWVLRFDNGITSAGIAAEDWLAHELGFSEGAPAWERVLARFPSVRDHFTGTEAVVPFIHSPRLSYRCRVPQGHGFTLLPSALGFVDPLFSTGFPLTLLGIHRLGRTLREHGGIVPYPDPEQYDYRSTQELTAAAFLVNGCYSSFADFSSFTALSMLYFAAASYSEMARRLGRGDLASQFLLGSRPAFQSAFTRHVGKALEGLPVDPEAVRRDLEPFNIAGLCDPVKRNWYGVDLQDVVRGATKLEQTPDQVLAFIARMGW
jgi:FADH2 O2-dependent halogenase